MDNKLKKTTSSLGRNLFPVNLNFNDIKILIEILSEYFKYIKIQIDGFDETDNLELIKNYKTTNLNIKCYKNNEDYFGGITFYFNKDTTRIIDNSNGRDNTIIFGIIYKAETFLKTKRNNFKNILVTISDSRYFHIITLASMLILNFILINIQIGIIIFIIYTISQVLAYIVRFHFYNNIRLKEKKENNFFQDFINETPKAMWQIITGLILLIVGYYLGQNKQIDEKELTEKVKLAPKEIVTKLETDKNISENKNKQTAKQ